MEKNTEQMAQFIIATCEGDAELTVAVLRGLIGLVSSNIELVEPVVEVESADENWYDEFRSSTTTVKVKGNTVQVDVARGHADEWHDKLRTAGFKWSKKNRNWWAYLDDEKRAEVAKRNIENDKLTAGMTSEQKREFWAARRAARNVA